MNSETVFRITVLVMMLGYIIPRSYYRRKARQASPGDQLPLKDTTESKVRLVLLGVCGLSADLLSIAWAINPQWLVWSSLELPTWLGYSLLIVERARREEHMMLERFGDEYRAFMQQTGRFLPRLARAHGKATDSSSTGN